MVNIDTGTVRTVVYCGVTYTVQPGAQYGANQKQFWTVLADGAVVVPATTSITRAAGSIHRHAVDSGAYANEYRTTGRAPILRLRGR